MFLEYYEYQSFGGTLDETAFMYYELQAEGLINWYTFNRLMSDTTYSDEVKECTYLLINLIELKHETLNPGGFSGNSNKTAAIESQSNDGVTTKYATLSAYNSLAMAKSEISGIIQKCLRSAVNSLGRNLLYRGLYPGE